MALAHLTINLDAFTGDDHPPDAVVLDDHARPRRDHIDAANDVIHVRTIVVSLDRQGKAATANGVPCVDGKVPVVAGVAYAVSAPNVLRDGPHYIPALTAGQVVDLSDYITPGAPLTPDQAAIPHSPDRGAGDDPPDHGALTGLGEDDPPPPPGRRHRRRRSRHRWCRDNRHRRGEAALHAHSNKAALDLVRHEHGRPGPPDMGHDLGKPPWSRWARRRPTPAPHPTAGLCCHHHGIAASYATAAQGAKADTGCGPTRFPPRSHGKSDKTAPQSLADGVLPPNTRSAEPDRLHRRRRIHPHRLRPPGDLPVVHCRRRSVDDVVGREGLHPHPLPPMPSSGTHHLHEQWSLHRATCSDPPKDFGCRASNMSAPRRAPSTLLGYPEAMLVRAINNVASRSTCAANAATASDGQSRRRHQAASAKNLPGSRHDDPGTPSPDNDAADRHPLDLDVDGIHRVAYLAGCDDVTGVTRWQDQYIADGAVPHDET